jgi:hypothetical protein
MASREGMRSNSDAGISPEARGEAPKLGHFARSEYWRPTKRAVRGAPLEVMIPFMVK